MASVRLYIYVLTVDNSPWLQDDKIGVFWNDVTSDFEVKRNYERTVRLRQSILKSAFEGKLVDQDPTDEPASALLERIKATRAAMKTDNPKHKKQTGKRSRS